jgi:tetratricopeptide (TPR) repeat protein
VTARVFISYGRTERDYVEQLAPYLAAQGLEAWFDRDIAYSAQWWQAIVDRIRSSHALVLVMTPELEQSEWVVKEVLLARREGKPIFPLLLRGEGLPLVIDIQHVDVSGGIMPPPDFVANLAAAHRPPVEASRSEVALDAVVHEVGRQEETLAAADRALADGRGDARVHAIRAAALNQLLRHDDALAAAEAALAVNAVNLPALLEKGKALAGLERENELLPLTDALLAREPSSAVAMALRAVALCQTDAGEARRWAERALAVAPDDLDAQMALIGVLVKEARLDEAKERSRSAITTHADRPDAYLMLAGALLLGGEHEEATRLADSLALIYPRSEAPALMQATAAMIARDWERAESRIRIAIERNPRRPGNYDMLAVILSVSGRQPEAMAAWEQARRAMPQPFPRDLAYILERLASALREAGRGAEARQAAQQAVDADPESASSGLTRALLAMDDGDADTARGLLRAAIDADPGIAEDLQGEAQACYERGRFDDVLLLCDVPLAAGLSSWSVHYRRGLALMRLERWHEAVAALAVADGEWSGASEEEKASLLFLEGRVLANRLGRPEQARQVLLRARDLDPADASVLMMLAEVSRSLGLEQDAARFEREAAERDERVQVLGRAEWWMSEDRFEEALQALDGASPRWGGTAEVQELRGRCLDRLGRPEEALAAIRLAERLVPEGDVAERASLIEHQGVLLRRLGRPIEAQVAFLRGLELRPADPGPLLGLTLLALDVEDADAVRQRVETLVTRDLDRRRGDVVEVALAVLKAGHPEPALRLLDRLTGYGDDAWNANLTRVEALQRLGRLQEALAALRPLESGLPAHPGPEHASVFAMRGELLHRLGRPLEARPALERALQLDRSLPLPHLVLSAIAVGEGNGATAAREAIAALEVDTEGRHRAAVLEIAQALDRNRRFEPALDVAEKLLAQGWDSTGARFTRWHALHMLNRSEQAAEAVAHLADTGPDEVTLQEVAAVELFRAGRLEQAAGFGERAIALGSVDPELYRAVVSAYLELERPDAARRAARRGSHVLPDADALVQG